MHKNLKDKGLYIFNLNYLLYSDNITKLIIDWIITKDTKNYREIQYGVISKVGALFYMTRILS